MTRRLATFTVHSCLLHYSRWSVIHNWHADIELTASAYFVEKQQHDQNNWITRVNNVVANCTLFKTNCNLTYYRVTHLRPIVWNETTTWHSVWFGKLLLFLRNYKIICYFTFLPTLINHRDYNLLYITVNNLSRIKTFVSVWFCIFQLNARNIIKFIV